MGHLNVTTTRFSYETSQATMLELNSVEMSMSTLHPNTQALLTNDSGVSYQVSNVNSQHEKQ